MAGAYPPFMPPGHALSAEIPSTYSNGMLHNNISPGALNSYHRTSLFDPHAAHMRPSIGNIPGGKP